MMGKIIKLRIYEEQPWKNLENWSILGWIKKWSGAAAPPDIHGSVHDATFVWEWEGNWIRH